MPPASPALAGRFFTPTVTREAQRDSRESHNSASRGLSKPFPDASPYWAVQGSSSRSPPLEILTLPHGQLLFVYC